MGASARGAMRRLASTARAMDVPERAGIHCAERWTARLPRAAPIRRRSDLGSL